MLSACKKDSPSSGQVETITFSQESYTVTEGETLNLKSKLTITPETVADTVTINWSVNNTDYATISKSGKLSALMAGKVTVTAMAGGKTATCTVKIDELEIEKFTIPAKFTCMENVPAELKVVCEPEGASAGHIKFTFPKEESENISCYYEEGIVYVLASKIGTYHLTASYGELKDQTCEITVTIAKIEKVSLTADGKNMEKDETKQLTLTVTPKEAKYGDIVVWKTSDSNIATVDDGVVTSHNYGEVVITAEVGKVAEGETIHTAKCTIRVSIKAIEKIEISDVSINLNQGQSKQLSVTVTPADAKYANVIKWESRHPDIATVDESGNVVGKSSGYATIDVKVGADKEGEQIYVKSCEVKVKGSIQTGTDQCGNSFKYGQIGSYIWMFENFRCTNYDSNAEAKGSVLKHEGTDPLTYEPYYIEATNQANWQPNSMGYLYADALTPEIISKFGYAYNWSAAVAVADSKPVYHEWTQRQGICPNGWHIPTKDEFENLAMSCGGESLAGRLLKSKSGWSSKGNGTDDFGFNALPAAVGSDDWYGAGGETSFWTITSTSDKDDAGIRTPSVVCSDGTVNLFDNKDKEYVAFIRCVKNSK